VLFAFAAAALVVWLLVVNTHIANGVCAAGAPCDMPSPIIVVQASPWAPPNPYFKSETPVYAVSTGMDPAVATLLGIALGGGLVIVATLVAGRHRTPTV
jgi:hypothetical protein